MATLSCSLSRVLPVFIILLSPIESAWPGCGPFCSHITCPAFPSDGVGIYSPPDCNKQAVRVNSICGLICPSGYAISPGAHHFIHFRLCLSSGRWDKVQKSCKDIEPPSITCPVGEIMTADTDPGRNTSNVAWTIKVTDNSLTVESDAAIQVSSSHDSPHDFPIGHTEVRVKATDQAGNTNECTFTVVIKDAEAPTFTFCPSDIEMESKSFGIRVNWRSARAMDNSGNPPRVSANRQSGDIFSVPGKYEITYRASDESNNVAECSFVVTLKKATCKIHPAPKNGALVCFQDPAKVSFCSVSCKVGTDFVFNPPLTYYCVNAEWHHWGIPGLPYESRLPWPDCSATAAPSSVRRLGQPFFYFNGDSSDVNVQNVLKRNFISLLKSPYIPPTFCMLQPRCTEQNTQVYVGQKS